MASVAEIVANAILTELPWDARVDQSHLYLARFYGAQNSVRTCVLDMRRHAYVCDIVEPRRVPEFDFWEAQATFTPRPEWLRRGGSLRELRSQMEHITADIGPIAIRIFEAKTLYAQVAACQWRTVPGEVWDRISVAAQQIGEGAQTVVTSAGDIAEGSARTVNALGEALSTTGDIAHSAPRATGFFLLGALGVAAFFYLRRAAA